MNRYRIVKELGDGTYGTVFQAVHLSSGAAKRRCMLFETLLKRRGTFCLRR